VSWTVRGRGREERIEEPGGGLCRGEKDTTQISFVGRAVQKGNSWFAWIEEKEKEVVHRGVMYIL